MPSSAGDRDRQGTDRGGLVHAARIAGGESWRDLMGPAREVAAELSRAGIRVTRQKGADVDAATVVGPIRLARGPRWRTERPERALQVFLDTPTI